MLVWNAAQPALVQNASIQTIISLDILASFLVQQVTTSELPLKHAFFNVFRAPMRTILNYCALNAKVLALLAQAALCA